MSLSDPLSHSVAIDLRSRALARRSRVAARRGAERRWARIRLGVDAAMIALAGLAVVALEPRAIDLSAGVVRAVAGGAVVVGVLAALGRYRRRLHLELLEDLRAVVSATAIATMALVTADVVTGHDVGDGSLAVHGWIAASIALGAGRAATAHAHAAARRRGTAARRTLVIGAGRIGRRAAARLLERPELGLRPIGFLDKEPLAGDPATADLPVLGASWDLERVVAEHDVDHVVVGFSTAPHGVLLALVRRCWELGLSVSVVPRLFELEGERAGSEHLGGLPLVELLPADPHARTLAVKYACDRVLAGAVLLLLAPLMLVIAAAVRLTTGGPVLYRQARAGRDGEPFDMLKFRTMERRPESAGESDAAWAEEILDRTGRGVPQAAAAPEADRRTPVGRILRRYSLDELPQLLNVVRGDMSLIGPRPERVHYAGRFERSVYRYGARHRIKPGMTGWAQVNGLRGETSLRDRVEWDNFYIENWSPWLDVKIAARTVGAVLEGGGR